MALLLVFLLPQNSSPPECTAKELLDLSSELGLLDYKFKHLGSGGRKM